MKYAGINTVEAIMDNIKGDMSSLTSAIVPTFESVYDGMEDLNDEIEALKTSVEYVTVEEAEAWFA